MLLIIVGNRKECSFYYYSAGCNLHYRPRHDGKLSFYVTCKQRLRKEQLNDVCKSYSG